MALIDLFIGGFVLPMRYLSNYGSPLTSKLCAALTIGESCALGLVIYTVTFMIYARLYDLKRPSAHIRQHYPLIFSIVASLALFVFYGIPFMANYTTYLLRVVSTASNATMYCSTYMLSVYRPSWMSYIEIGAIYVVPFLSNSIGLACLVRCLHQPKPGRMNVQERKQYKTQRQTTWHVLLLGSTFLFLWLPWVTIRILVVFHNIRSIQRALQISYYVLMFKSVLFPILYAASNSNFRCSFAIYRHKRITMNNRVWTLNGPVHY